MSSHGQTDTGRVRPNNEDQYLIAALGQAVDVEQTSLASRKLPSGADRGHLFMVADGMGGHAGGQHASALAIQSMQESLVDAFQQRAGEMLGDKDRILREVRKALAEADAQVCAESERRPELYGMGTTVTAALSCGDQLYVVHAGDSRCYLLRGGTLTQLTRDHTMAQEMVRLGVLTATAARTHGWRHVITNAVGGTEAGVQPELHHRTLEPGDCLLLCTDGLTEMVTPEEITAILEEESDPRRACERLVNLANERGGKDNITVVIARYADPAS